MRIETPNGSVNARARFNATLNHNVVCGQHGWWQSCSEIGAPGYDPFSQEGANLNLIINTADMPQLPLILNRAVMDFNDLYYYMNRGLGAEAI